MKFKIIFIASAIVAAHLFLATGVSAQEATYFIHSDHLGSTTLITQNGSIVEKSLYYPYGTERSQKLDVGSKITEKTYTGQTSDISDSGLMYYNARYYNPTLAKFTQADSMGDGLNKYGYVLNNPMNSIDPTGNMDALPDDGGIGRKGRGCVGLDCIESKSDRTHNKSVGVFIFDYGRMMDDTDPSWTVSQMMFSYHNMDYHNNYTVAIDQAKWLSDELGELLSTDFDLKYYVIHGLPPISYDKGSKTYQFDYGTFIEKYMRPNGVTEAWYFDPGYGHAHENLWQDGLVISSFNYNRENSKMLHTMGHRAEGALSITNPNQTTKEIFDIAFGGARLRNFNAGSSGLGIIHRPLNAVKDYQYDNYSYSLLNGKLINCEYWGCNQEGYLTLWFYKFGNLDPLIDTFLNPPGAGGN